LIFTGLYNIIIIYILTDDPMEVLCNDAINNPGMYTKGYTVSSTRSKYFWLYPFFFLCMCVSLHGLCYLSEPLQSFL